MSRPSTDFGQSPLPIEVSTPDTDSRQASFEVSLLGLSAIDGLGRKGIKAFIREFRGDLGAIWKAAPDQLRKVLTASKVPSAEAIASTITQDARMLIDTGVRKLDEGPL